MKVVSIDIETTGINPEEDQVVQLGAVLFDTNADFKPKFYNKIVLHTQYHGNEFAMNMNRRLIEIAYAYQENPLPEYTEHFVKNEDLAKDFRKWLNEYKAFGGEKSINVAGKNVSGFDMQFLLKCPEFAKRVPFKRRTLDPAILCYLDTDICLPDLHECVNRTFKGFTKKETSHLGDSDALDVAAILWTKLKGSKSSHIIRIGRLLDKYSEILYNNTQELYEKITGKDYEKE